MSDVTIIFGAGASKPSGAPLMAEFFDRATSLHKAGDLADAGEDFRLVEEARWELQRTAAKSSLDLYNLEGVFVALEMAEVLNGIGALTPEHCKAASAALKRLIASVLENSMPMKVKDGGVLLPVDGYFGFARSIKKLLETDSKRRVNLITFNYDIGLDHALHHEGIGWCYGLPGYSSPEKRVGLYKLHGSLNWTTPKAGGGGIDVSSLAPPQLHQLAVMSRHNRCCLPVAAHLRRTAHEKNSEPVPFLVPPTDSKLEYRRQIAPVWREAAARLASSSTIMVIGFSLPPTDVFFRNFFAVGSISKTFIERFVVVDPSEAASTRIRDLLSRDVERRFHWEPTGFVQATGFIDSVLFPRGG
jgi:hypothetical protein